jgi:hypothetical protein
MENTGVAFLMATRPNPRRDNAPIRKRKPATTVPDLLIAVAAAAWLMGFTLALATAFGDQFTAGEVGRALARVFAATLGVVGLMMFLMALVLLRDEREQADHYRIPLVVGSAVGVAEGLLFIFTVESVIFVPLFFLIFSLRPLRRMVASIAGRQVGR